MNSTPRKFVILCITYALLLGFALLHFGFILNTLGMLWRVIFPLVLGGCIAFILSIPMNAIEKKYDKYVRNKLMRRIKRPVSLLLTLIVFISVLLIIFFSIIPELGRTFAKISDQAPVFMDNTAKWLESRNIHWENLEDYLKSIDLSFDKIRESVINYVKEGGGAFFSSTLDVVKKFFTSITTFLLGLIFAIYILLSKEKLAAQILRLLYAILPESTVEDIKYVSSMTHKSFAGFLSSQCLEGLISGIMFFVVMSLFRLPYPLLISMVIGVTTLVPIVGAFVGMFFGIFLILMVSPVQVLWFSVIFIILQQIESNLIYPFVVGSSVGLPPIWVLLAVLVGGGLMGVIGMIIFIPTFSVLYVLIGDQIQKRLREKNVPLSKTSEEY